VETSLSDRDYLNNVATDVATISISKCIAAVITDPKECVEY
jgi:hypothetical protein